MFFDFFWCQWADLNRRPQGYFSRILFALKIQDWHFDNYIALQEQFPHEDKPHHQYNPLKKLLTMFGVLYYLLRSAALLFYWLFCSLFLYWFSCFLFRHKKFFKKINFKIWTPFGRNKTPYGWGVLFFLLGRIDLFHNLISCLKIFLYIW